MHCAQLQRLSIRCLGESRSLWGSRIRGESTRSGGSSIVTTIPGKMKTGKLISGIQFSRLDRCLHLRHHCRCWRQTVAQRCARHDGLHPVITANVIEELGGQRIDTAVGTLVAIQRKNEVLPLNRFGGCDCFQGTVAGCKGSGLSNEMFCASNELIVVDIRGRIGSK